jgi:GNAT superfamily N-acetyltransferase
MQLTEVKNRETAKEFLKVPHIIYKDNPIWVAPLEQDVESVFDPRKNDYYNYGEATRWILKKEGKLIGRVAAFINRRLADTFRQPTGGMGFFECINDKEAAFLLFDTCKEWLEQRGMQAMDGPVNFGEKERFWGLLVDGFNTRPTYLMNYNQPYYQKLFEDYGFQNFYNQYVYNVATNTVLHPIFEKKYERLVTTQGYTFEHLDLKQLDKFGEDFRTIYNTSWEGTHKFFKPMTQQQALMIFNKMKDIIDPDLIWFAYHEGKPVSFLIAIPELNRVLRFLKGRLGTWGKIKFLFYKMRGELKTIHGLAFGTVPAYRNRGIESALIISIRNIVLNRKWYEDMYMNWLGDFNPKMINIIEAIGSKKVFSLVTYRKLFDEKAEFERHPVLD